MKVGVEEEEEEEEDEEAPSASDPNFFSRRAFRRIGEVNRNFVGEGQ